MKNGLKPSSHQNIFFSIFRSTMKLLVHILLFLPLTHLLAQVDLSGVVTYPDSVGVDLIRVEVWKNNQQAR